MKEDEIAKRDGLNVRLLQKMNPNYSTCYKCGLPWNECKPKIVMSESSNGIFAMCEYCWGNSTVEERIHHYKSLYLDHKNKWGHDYDFGAVEKEIIKMSSLDNVINTCYEKRI